MKVVKIFWHSVYMNTTSYMRVKESLFFSFVFPVFLFTLFGFIWGGNYESYIQNIYIGIIGMTIASDALFSVGPIIRIYLATNTLKALKVLPFNITIHFVGLAISRLIAVLASVTLLTISSALVFDYLPSLYTITLIIIGLFVGSAIFSFMGLFIAFLFKAESGRGIISFIYFIMLFLSGAFYPLSIMPEFLQFTAKFLPLTHFILFLKGEEQYLIYLITDVTH